MNLFKNNQFDTIEKLSNTHVFYSIIKLHRIKIKDFIDNKLTDKNTLHSYVNVYEDIFDSLRYTAKNILEIGMAPGGSIMVWRNYFINAHIYGIDTCNLDDIHSQSIKHDYHITLFPNTNGYNAQFIRENFTNKNIKFDMILDDASHTLEDIIYFIIKYLPLLSDNGIMVIENIQKMEWIEILKLIVPDEFKKNIQIYDLRHIKNRYDDVLFVVNKNSFIQLNY
jgi:23S rRNA U2552 (ribose-2'-O)-methylase RlmE/FtsJ